ncbi:MAG: DUF1592 domain-containing protein [Armatimonadetes bacterium]|nr:DUF1592 domain-containing protein [Armatimonadota bacterium]
MSPVLSNLSPRPIGFMVASAMLMTLGLALPVDAHQKSKPKTIDGAAVFKNRCAGCHGDKGQGGDGYSKPLIGKLSAPELANFIKKSMPPGTKKCPADEADKVAQFMFDAFYSPIAQERNKPARIALARLTVRQYRNAVADLVGNYHAASPSQAPVGLHAQYFNARNFDQKTKLIDRVDPEIKFDFGNQGPDPAKFDARNFSIMWDGSILAPDTGEYEFVLKSDQAVRLFVNGGQPIIDGFIRSGNQKEFHGTITLLGGRAYYMRLEFSKATQGVKDEKKENERPPGHAEITLMWRRPKQALEVVPTRFLYNQWSPNGFVVTTPFPPDDRSMGYERGNAVSKSWDDAVTSAAIETANYVADHRFELSGTKEDDPQVKDKLTQYCDRFVTRAFRSPIDAGTERLYVKKQFDSAPNLETAVKRSVMLTLMSPRFLYREIGTGQKDAYRIAADLSFGLWDTLPDPELERAAANGALTTSEQITKQAERMVRDPRAWVKLKEFLLLWLKVDDVPEIVKSPKLFPAFDANTTDDLRSSLELFLENTAWSEASDYRQMMMSPTVYLNGELAKLYGVNLPADAPFQAVQMDSGKRTGLITQPYILSRFAYLETSSPIHRGVLIVRNLLGKTLNPPPSAFAPDPVSLHPNLTTRERVALQTKPEMCNNCHGIINPIGFTLENYDAIGRWRDKENGKPVDDSGYYRNRTGNMVKFSGSADLAKYLADSDECHDAFIEKLFLHLVKQPVLAYGPKTLPTLEQSFAQNSFSIRKLMVEIMVATTARDVGRTPDK